MHRRRKKNTPNRVGVRGDNYGWDGPRNPRVCRQACAAWKQRLAHVSREKSPNTESSNQSEESLRDLTSPTPSGKQ